MKKRIFLALLAAVSTIVMVGCGKDDKKDDPQPAKVSAEAKYTETENSVEFTYPTYADDATNPVYSTTMTYKFDGNKVVENKAVVVCASALVAEEMIKTYESEKDLKDNIEKVEKNGNTITVTYKLDEDIDKEAAIFGARVLADAMGCENVPEPELTID